MTSGEGRRTAVVELPPEPRSAPLARAMVRENLVGTDQDDLVETLQQCITELVTNAVLHAGTPIRVELHAGRVGVRIEVHDGSTSVPVMLPHTATASTGRGLAMVAALSDAWGVEVSPRGGKVVWCEVNGLRAAEDETDLDADLAAWGLLPAELGDRLERQDEPPAAGGHPVVLVGYPVDLGLRLQEHYEAVVRECQLLAAPRAPGADALPERLLELAAILADRYLAELGQLARPDPRRIAAQSHGLASIDLTYCAGDAQLALLVSWQRILDEVDEFSARGDLLAPRMAPELAQLRGWALTEFGRQSKGQPPRPWSSLRLGG